MRRASAIVLLALAAQAQDRTIATESDAGSLAFSADGATVAVTCRDRKVRLYDVKSGALQKTVPWSEGDAAITLLDRADVLATAAKDGAIQAWDLTSGAKVRSIAGPTPRVADIAFSADRKLVAAAGATYKGRSEETVRVWDAAGKERFAIPAGIGGTSAMAFSPDGATLVAASWDTNVRAFSARNGELLRLIAELPVSMFAIEFSPDGKLLATAGVDRTIYLWETRTWKVARKITGQPEMISSLAFTRDGSKIATGGFSELTNRNPVQVIVWDTATGRQLRSVTEPHIVRSVAFSPDGKWLAASAGEKRISLWSVPQ